MIVYSGGTFDLFHYGHVRFLARCRELAKGGEVVISLNTDEFVESYKGRPPIIPYDGRKEVLEACRYVDRVIPNSGGADSKPAIESVHPNIIAIGSDWSSKDYYAQMGFTPAWLVYQGISLVYVPYTDGISASMVRATL
jgi:glycerol-3-phosphate cytidylyltransferase